MKNKLTIGDLAMLGVQLSYEQRQSLKPDSEHVAWMVPWQLPDPEYLAGWERYGYTLPDHDAGGYKTVWWPRVAHRVAQQYEAEAREELNDEHGEHWDLLPQVVAFVDHLLCDAGGCCCDEPPQPIGVWAAWPLTLAQNHQLEVQTSRMINTSIWSPLLDFYSFEERQGYTITQLEDMATAPITPDMGDVQAARTALMNEEGAELLKDWSDIKSYLGIKESPDELDISYQHFPVKLDEELMDIWTQLKARCEHNRKVLTRAFPEEKYYIEASSQWF